MWAENTQKGTVLIMNEFKTYHPIVNFLYFVFVIGFSCFFMHPICLIISLVCGFLSICMEKGVRNIAGNLIFIIPLFVVTALINPAFNHEGATILTYFPDGNPLTLESIYYGICAALMLLGVTVWFFFYTEIMTSDKFIYLFGKIIPSMSLVISMTLRFVPRFISQFKMVINAQKCMGNSITEGSLIKRGKNLLKIFSAMISWALENAIETADSMKARGYGLPGRTAFSIYTMEKRDKLAVFFILVTGAYILVGRIMGFMEFKFFPYIKGAEINLISISMYFAYLLLMVSPVILEVWEVRRWNALRSKI